MAKFLVIGATGQTGRLLTRELLRGGHRVTAVVRNEATLGALKDSHGKSFNQIVGTVLDMSEGETKEAVEGSDAVLLCLGHNLTLSGVFGPPRKLVFDTLKKLVAACLQNPQGCRKVVLMNSIGVPSDGERYSFAERALLGMLYW